MTSRAERRRQIRAAEKAANDFDPALLPAIDQTAAELRSYFEDIGVDLRDEKIASAVLETIRVLAVAGSEGSVVFFATATALGSLVQEESETGEKSDAK